MTAELLGGRATFPRASIDLLQSLLPHTALVTAHNRNTVSAENCLDS
jgi:hypothetical protein